MKNTDQLPQQAKTTLCFKLFRRHLLLSVFIGVCVGFCVGFGVRMTEPTEYEIIWIGLPGEMFINMLKMLVLPLVISSIITGTASLDPKLSGRIGGFSFIYIVVTNSFGAILAVILFYIFKPGDDNTFYETDSILNNENHQKQEDIFLDMIRNLIPDNIVTASFEKKQTKYTPAVVTLVNNGTNTTERSFVRANGTARGSNLLGLIIVCSVIGIATRKSGDTGRPFIALFKSLADIIFIILRWIVWLMPFGVASLIAAALASVTDIDKAFANLGKYFVAFILGIVLHQIGIIPIMYFVTTRKNPFRLLITSIRPWIAIFASCSSAVAMPEILNTLEDKNNVDKNISSVFVPLGVVLGRCGSCYFICLSSLFLLNMEMEDVTLANVLLISVLSAVGSLAIPSIPSASIVTVMIITSSLNIRPAGIGLLMTLEWFTDRIRATSNGMTTIFGGILIDKVCRTALDKAKRHDNELNTKTDPDTTDIDESEHISLV